MTLGGMICEPGTDKLSFTRVILGVTIMFANSWVTLLVIKKGLIPDLSGLALYLGAIGTVTFGFNQAKSAVETIVNKEQPK